MTLRREIAIFNSSLWQCGSDHLPCITHIICEVWVCGNTPQRYQRPFPGPQLNPRNGPQNSLWQQLTPVITEQSPTAAHTDQSQPPLSKLANDRADGAAMAQYKGQPKSRAVITFFHSLAVKTWSSKHQEISSNIRLPGVVRVLCSLTGNSSSRCIAALGTPPARHSTPSSADSTLCCSTYRSSALGPASLIYQDWQTKWHTCQYCTMTKTK
jgi:hypothetical protein